MMNKVMLQQVKQLQKRGWVLENRKKHQFLISPDGKIRIPLPYGHNRDRVPGGNMRGVMRTVQRWESGHDG
jgi:predicted RNA binding protein YcfA (HicA-like mRNA interferase family)